MTTKQKLNEQKSHLTESWQDEGQRTWTVRLPGLAITFGQKAEAKEFKRLYDKASKSFQYVTQPR